MEKSIIPPEILGIGQIGLGSITETHRAGYQKYGQPLVAGFDPSPEARARFAEMAPDATVYDTLKELLADERVGVLDIATPHHRESRLPAVRAAAAAGKPMLIQKPLSYTYTEAVELADIVKNAGVCAMVNQNMCFTPGSLHLIDALMRDRMIGAPDFAQVTVQYRFDMDYHPWFGKEDRWWTDALTVHHFGLLQLLFGPPESVYAVTGRDIRQPGVTHDGYGHALLRYPSGHAVAITSTGTYYGIDEVRHGNEKLWVQGPDGIIDWQPHSGLIISRRNKDNDKEIERTKINWSEDLKWFPDAFGLTMAHFRQALIQQQEPFCSMEDNLYVMAVVEAVYMSSRENRAIPLTEIMGERYNLNYGTGYAHGFIQWQPPVPCN